MTLAVGDMIGPYRVLAKLGEGGMGEVYRARDTQLDRDVAIKILPDAFASDPDRLARFEREAKTLASLNDPHIAQIYGLEKSGDVRALVLELVDGPTLADRIARGPIPIDEALPIARQIADALDAAHEQGIVHRDLKPANIKVRDDGAVKVLDFGLAKALDTADDKRQTADGVMNSPTITSPALMTGVGVILGTAAYMSPEQAKGREADKRSDIWAFGCVLYEMLTGTRAFDGEDMTDVLGAVVRLEPKWTALPADVPPAVRTVIQQCLVKDRRQRISEISTAKFVLAELNRLGTSDAPVTMPTPPRWRSMLPLAAATALVAVAVGVGAWLMRPAPASPVVTRFSFTLPEGQAFSGTTRPIVAISPDGTRVAYVANARIYLRSIGELEAHEIPGTATAAQVWNPMFAPDGLSVAFLESATPSTPYKLSRIPIAGGTPSTLATLPAMPNAATWSPAGILMHWYGGDIMRVSPNGGVPEPIASIGTDEAARDLQLLPGGRTLLFTVSPRPSEDRSAQVVMQPLSGGSRRVLVEGGGARYLPSGHLLYAVGGTMHAVPFDAASLTITGSPVPVIAGVNRRGGSTHLAVSESGALAYIPGPVTTTAQLFSVVTGNGREDPVALKLPVAAYEHPRVSPDGRVLAIGRNDGRDSDIWTYDLSEKTQIRRLTFGRSNRFPVWSADGRRVTFQSRREGDRAIFWQLVSGGSAERLTKPAAGEEHVPEAWSRDGRQLLFSVTKESRNFLWVFTLGSRKTEPVGGIQSAEPFSATFSPDGRFVAYAFSETQGGSGIGKITISPDRGVYVTPFPAMGERHQIPKVGVENHPVWSPDGASIFFATASGQSVVSVPITTSLTVAFGTPVELTRGPRTDIRSNEPRGYDVTRDGRFVNLLPEFGDGSSAGSNGEIRVVLNWFEELKRLVPTK